MMFSPVHNNPEELGEQHGARGTARGTLRVAMLHSRCVLRTLAATCIAYATLSAVEALVLSLDGLTIEEWVDHLQADLHPASVADTFANAYYRPAPAPLPRVASLPTQGLEILAHDLASTLSSSSSLAEPSVNEPLPPASRNIASPAAPTAMLTAPRWKYVRQPSAVVTGGVRATTWQHPPRWRGASMSAMLRYVVEQNASTASLARGSRSQLKQPSSRFEGHQSPAERVRALLHGCPAGQPLHCGFLAPSSFGQVRPALQVASRGCRLAVVPAIFGCKDRLQQPAKQPPALKGCFFAFVDADTMLCLRSSITVVGAGAMVGTSAPTNVGQSQDSRSPPQVDSPAAASPHRALDAFVGVWRLVPLESDELPFGPDRRRNSRVPKLLLHRLFPDALFGLWVDGKLRLHIDPLVAVQRFLVDSGAVFAAPQNLRRDTIDQEYEWIVDKLCRMRQTHCVEVHAQWRQYLQEQAVHAGWEGTTQCIEGALLLADLRSSAACCLLCNWFNEYALFSERYQLSFSYVQYAMGLTRNASMVATTNGSPPPPLLNLLPRQVHWSVNMHADTREKYSSANPFEIARHVGHAKKF